MALMQQVLLGWGISMRVAIDGVEVLWMMLCRRGIVQHLVAVEMHTVILAL
jgi:hypothetical protein